MAQPQAHGLILAGGRGTRFWPRSRRARAKQVLNVTGERTLIQETVSRLAPVIPPQRIWILTNDLLRSEIVRQLPEVPKRQILSEPVARNTAPAIGLAAQILASVDPEALLGVFPSDHVIEKPSVYLRLVRAAFKEAARGRIAVLGVAPRWAETGYGYMEFAAAPEAGAPASQPVVSFREKPDLATAEQYVSSGRFFWNAGMFFFRAAGMLEELRRHMPKTATLLASLPAFSSRKFASALAEAFPLCENVSIDYAVIEKARGIQGIPCPDFGWNDVGSWNAVYDLTRKDAAANASRSPLIAIASKGNFVDAGGKLVALAGVDDLIVVDTPDALLITRRDRAQQVGDIVRLIEKQKREELL